MINAAGDIVLINKQAEALLGYNRRELMGRKIEVLIPERYRQNHPGHREGFMAAPSARPMGLGRDLYALRKDGKEIPVEIGLTPIQIRGGRFVMAALVDLTERRLMERKLAHSQTLAAVGGMAAAMAHEIRNPLGSITMGAKALVRGGLGPEDLQQVMSVLVAESQRLNRTLDHFLQFSRPREPKPALGDLNALVHEVLAAVKADERVAGRARVREKLDRKLPRLAFDADLLRQVLWNLIRNGFQALEGKGLLEVETERRPSEAVIHVSDTGPGISEEQLPKLFSPFHTTKAKGTGLGLSISRNIVFAHGGEIKVESTPGRGSRFSVALPLPRRS